MKNGKYIPSFVVFTSTNENVSTNGIRMTIDINAGKTIRTYIFYLFLGTHNSLNSRSIVLSGDIDFNVTFTTSDEYKVFPFGP